MKKVILALFVCISLISCSAPTVKESTITSDSASVKPDSTKIDSTTITAPDTTK